MGGKSKKDSKRKEDGSAGSKRKALAGDAEDEQQSKRTKAGGCCEACRKRPQQTKWASVDGDGLPLGERCAECVEQWTLGFLYLAWSDYCQLHRTEVICTQKKRTLPFPKDWICPIQAPVVPPTILLFFFLTPLAETAGKPSTCAKKIRNTPTRAPLRKKKSDEFVLNVVVRWAKKSSQRCRSTSSSHPLVLIGPLQ